MKKLFTLLTMLVICISGMWGQVTNRASAGNPMTFNEFKDLADTGKHFAIVAPSTNVLTYNKWFSFSNNGYPETLTTTQLFDLENSETGDGWYNIKRVSDGLYVSTEGGNFAASPKMDFKLVNRRADDCAEEFSNTDLHVSLDNAAGDHYNANTANLGFRGGTGGFSTYITYGPLYIVTINCRNSGELIRTYTYIVKDGTEINAPKSFVSEGKCYNITSDHSVTVNSSDITSDVNYTELTRVDELNTLSSSKKYVIYNNRGVWAVNENANDVNSTDELSLAFMVNDEKQQFAFIYYDNTDDGTDNGSYYLYSVSESKFAYVDGTKLSLTKLFNDAVAASPVTFAESTSSTYATSAPVVIQIGSASFGVSTAKIPDVYKYSPHLDDDGNASAIYEVGDFDKSAALEQIANTKSIEYHVVYDGTDKRNGTVYAMVGDELSIPSSLKWYGMAYESFYSDEECTSEITTVPDGGGTVYAKEVWNGPFAISPESNFDDAKWYYWKQSHQDVTNNYISYKEGAACPASTSKPESDAGLWAFIGNPYDGFKIINKGAGEGKYLQATDDYPSMTTTSTIWVIGGRNGFDTSYFNVHTGDTKYLNFQNDTFTLRYWNNASAANDNNSTYRVEEYSEDFTSSVETYISPYFENHGKYFAITDDAYTENSTMWEAAKSECNRSTYVNLTNIVNNNIIYPNDGWYLLKNYSTKTYLNTTSSSSVVSSTNNAPSSIVYLDKQEDGTYYIMSQGAYFQTPSIGSNVSRGATPVKFTTEIATAQVVDFKAGSYGLAADNGYIKAGYLRGTGTDAASYWTIEDISSVNISLTAANDNTGSAHTYATLCVPFNVTALTGADDKEVKAYAPTKDGDYIVPGTGATTITEGTPVLLIGEEGATSVTAKLGSSYATTPATSNVLTGTFTGTSIDCTASTGTNYVLGFDRDNNNRIGFYHVNSSSYSLKANRAYLNLTGGDARGFTLMFDDVVTGIVAPIGETEEGTVIYNLSGQRLNKVQKGINIVNGKKVLF